MSKVALYRKYRPKNFSEVYGQELIIKTLENAISQDSINHAYIFSGPRGSGKTSIAKIFSRAINCLNLKNNYDICCDCNGCKNSLDENSLDIIELDAASNNGINEIRNIINSVSFIPNHLKYKVYIIDEAHMLTTNSWNALLKTLEEPPKFVVFIFATTEYNKIPATIISRCQRFDFMRLNDNILTNLLTDISNKENIKIEYEAIRSIVSLSEGAARDAISILDQLTSFSTSISSDDVNDVFGLVNINNKIELLNFIFNNDIENIVLFLNKAYEKGVNFTILIMDLIKILFDKILYIQTNNVLFLKTLNEKNINELKNVELTKLINVMNHLSTNVFKISKSNDRLFETQLLLLQLLSIIENKCQVNVEKIDVKKQEDSFETKEETINHNLFKTEVRLINKPELIISDQQNVDVVKSFVPPKPCSFNNKIIEEPKNEVKDEKVEMVINDVDNLNLNEQEQKQQNIDYKDFFFRVANNNDNDLKTSMNDTYFKLQENRLLESPNINKLLLAKKILVCSKNGVVLLFDNIKQSDNFNNLLDSDEIKEWLINNFKRDFRIIGVDKNNAKLWTDEYKNIDTSKLVDVQLERDEKKDTKSLILDILSE